MKLLYLLSKCLMVLASAVTGTSNLFAKPSIVKALPLTDSFLSNGTASWINPPRPDTTPDHDPVQITNLSVLHLKEKRSADDAVKDLSTREWKETCKDSTTFHSIIGRYKTYFLEEPQG